MKITWQENETPYDVIEDIIVEKYRHVGCSMDFIVRIKLKYENEENYREYNELLYDETGDCFMPHLSWQYDWWEGEQKVELLGCIPIDRLEYPYPKQWLITDTDIEEKDDYKDQINWDYRAHLNPYG